VPTAVAGALPAGRRMTDGYRRVTRSSSCPGADYIDRTRKNVEDSDGTLIVTFGRASGGTARTVEFCRHLRKPHLVIDAATTPVDDKVRQAL
jgi:hypothetical protein